MTDWGLTGSVALVTGAAGGIGQAIADRLAEAGARVYASDTAPDGVDAGTSGLIVPIELDVTDRPAVVQVMERIAEESGKLDVLVNNAGLIRAAGLFELTEADWDVTLDVNAKGLLFCTQAAAEIMRSEGDRAPAGRSIVNIASTAGRDGRTMSRSVRRQQGRGHQHHPLHRPHPGAGPYPRERGMPRVGRYRLQRPAGRAVRTPPKAWNRGPGSSGGRNPYLWAAWRTPTRWPPWSGSWRLPTRRT